MSLSLAGNGTVVGFDSVASGFGGLVAVKSAIFTGVQTASVATGANVAVTDLTITHEVADPANKLIISAFVGIATTSEQRDVPGIAVHDGTSLIAIGNADGSRTRVMAGGGNQTGSAFSGTLISSPSGTFVHTPGAGSKTYTLRMINVLSGTTTLHVNRTFSDGNSAASARGASSLVIQEVSV